MARQPTQRPVQYNLPGLSRSDKVPKPPKRLEKVLQAHAMQALGLMGYAAMETGKARAKMKIESCCPRCKHEWTQWAYPTGWQGNTPGYPDVGFYRYSAGFPNVFIMVEMKGEDTAVTPEQQRLADNGRSVIAHSIQEAVRAVMRAEEAMDAYRFSPERRALMQQFLQENAGRLG